MGLMGWDEQTFMPTGAEEARANQKAALAGVIHEAKVDPKIGELIALLEDASSLTTVERANLREAKKSYQQNTRVSTDLASRSAQLESEGYAAWVRAREADDYKSFSSILAEILALTKQMLVLKKPEMALYDAAVDDFDPRMSTVRLAAIFDAVKTDLAPLIAKIGAKAPDSPVHQVPPQLRGGVDWDPAKQADMCKEIAEALGFDFTRGRMDVSVHPFTGGSHPSDVRITTRYSADNWIEGLAGTVHECGHAMYEQGRSNSQLDLPASQVTQPLPLTN